MPNAHTFPNIEMLCLNSGFPRFVLQTWGPRELAKQAFTYSSLISLYERRQRLPDTV
jgi:hypothetical protein